MFQLVPNFFRLSFLVIGPRQLEAWVGSLTHWKPGPLKAWPIESMAHWKPDPLEAWPIGSLTHWKPHPLEAWSFHSSIPVSKVSK